MPLDYRHRISINVTGKVSVRILNRYQVRNFPGTMFSNFFVPDNGRKRDVSL